MRQTFPRIVFVGAHMEAEAPFAHLIASGENIVGLFTLDEPRLARMAAAGRLGAAAEIAGIPVMRGASAGTAASLAWIRRLEPDLLLVIGWTQLLKPELLSVPRITCLGFHASLLPKYRGRAPVNWAIINGERETGNTLMVLAPGADEGDIVAQRVIPIREDDDCRSIYLQVSATECEMLAEVLPLIRQREIPRRPQDSSQATIMPKRRPEDGLIDWSRSSRDLYNWVRALTCPYPGAFSYCSGNKVMIWKAEVLGIPARMRAGAVAIDEAGHPIVATGDGHIRLLRVQRECEAAVSGIEAGRTFLRPPALFQSARLEKLS